MHFLFKSNGVDCIDRFPDCAPDSVTTVVMSEITFFPTERVAGNWKVDQAITSDGAMKPLSRNTGIRAIILSHYGRNHNIKVKTTQKQL